mgnify:CR=1 FL=1
MSAEHNRKCKRGREGTDAGTSERKTMSVRIPLTKMNKAA